MKIRMKYKKETKHTFVFEECNEEGVLTDNMFCRVPTLYIRKSALKTPAQYINLTLETEA